LADKIKRKAGAMARQATAKTLPAQSGTEPATSREAFDFKSRHASFDERNRLILDNLAKPGSWILDVGANLGAVSDAMARAGHIAIGIEKFARSTQLAARQCAPGTAFLCASVTPDLIRSSVGWDAILLLSVLHRLYAFEGPEMMSGVLAACGERSARLMIEGSTRHARYTDSGQPAPDFADLDVAAADQWHRALFSKTLGKAWTIQVAQPLACSAKEPFRLFYCLTRA
jgi:hypothetical protein